MTLNSLLEFAAVKQISLLDIDLIAEFLEPFWGTNKCRYDMSAFDCLPHKLKSCAPTSAQHN